MPIKQISPEDLEYVLIHCAATTPEERITAADVDQMHKGFGWRGIGYHIVIQRDGTVEPGRKWRAQGAHEPEVNDRSLAICMAGGIKDRETEEPEDNYTDAQWIALQAIVTVLKLEFPHVEVAGHNQFSNKACPCFDVPEWYEEMTSRYTL